MPWPLGFPSADDNVGGCGLMITALLWVSVFWLALVIVLTLVLS